MKTTCSTAIPLALVLALLTPVSAREFTSTDGKTLEGTVQTVTGGNVVIKVGTKNFTVPTTRFIAADQKYFKKWQVEAAKNKIPRLDAKISPGENNSNDRNDGFDDRKGSFDFTIAIENEEHSFDIKNAKGVLVVFGENCDVEDHYNVYQKQVMKVNIPAGETYNWQGREVHYSFDEGYPSKWGFKYYGYVFQLKNASGKVILTKVMPKRLEALAGAAMKLASGDQVGKNLNKLKRRLTVYD